MIGYLLLWSESLGAALLLAATVTALMPAWRRRWLATIPPAFVALLVFGVGVAVTWNVWDIESGGALPLRDVVYVLTWTAAFGVGSALILYRGLWSAAAAPERVARSWPRSRLAIACAALAMLTGITFGNMDLAVKVQLASVRVEASATTVALAPPHVADNENAALVYKRAFDALGFVGHLPHPDSQKVAVWLSKKQPWSDADSKELRAYLGRQERGLALLRKGAALPSCSFDHDYTRPILEMVLPELLMMQAAARFLALEALVKAVDGDTAAALDDVAALYKMAEYINDPILIAVVTSVRIEEIADKALESVLELSTPTAKELTRLGLEDNVSYQARFHRTVQMEAASGLSLFGSVFGLPDSEDEPWVQDFQNTVGSFPFGRGARNRSLYRVFVLQDDLAAYRRTMNSYYNLSHRPFHEAKLLPTGPGMVPGWEQLDRDIRDKRGVGLMAGMLIPAASGLVKVAVKGDAQHRLAQTAAAVTAYREKHAKKDPDTLDALVPEFLPIVPIDPFDGRPLQLKPTDDALILYSIGPDSKDDLVFRLKKH